MHTNDILDSVLAELAPVLKAAGREINIKEADETSCTIELVGFCGDCACTSSYIEGIQELLEAKAPQMKEIKFIQS